MTSKISVYNGIDRPQIWTEHLRGKRIGLLTNPSGVSRSLTLTSDILAEQDCLVCLFSPEHGVRGDRQAGAAVDTYADQKTGLPVYSLYSNGHHIPSEILDGLDAVAFDIQDVGARYYTYIYSLSYVMQDCAKANKEMIVFDRLNPLGGAAIEGTILDRKYASFIGRYPIASRHALTVGEFAAYINQTEHIHCKLTVIPLQNWSRDTLFCDTDLSWIAPSPNLPTFDSALCYIGTCLFEGTNVSEGRGTTRPFETVGAPWMDAEKIVTQLRQYSLPGVMLRPCYFSPVFSKHAGELCGGIQLHITDPRAFRPFETGLRLLCTIQQQQKEFSFTNRDAKGISTIERLLGCDGCYDAPLDATALIDRQRESLAAYRESIAPYLLYQ